MSRPRLGADQLWIEFWRISPTFPSTSRPKISFGLNLSRQQFRSSMICSRLGAIDRQSTLHVLVVSCWFLDSSNVFVNMKAQQHPRSWLVRTTFAVSSKLCWPCLGVNWQAACKLYMPGAFCWFLEDLSDVSVNVKAQNIQGELWSGLVGVNYDPDLNEISKVLFDRQHAGCTC